MTVQEMHQLVLDRITAIHNNPSVPRYAMMDTIAGEVVRIMNRHHCWCVEGECEGGVCSQTQTQQGSSPQKA